jgi:hypothetical protein
LRKIAAVAAIPVALLVEAAAMAYAVVNIRTITTGEQATSHIPSVLRAIATVKIALHGVATEITLTIAISSMRARAHITSVRIITTIAAIPIALIVETTNVANTVVPRGNGT